MIFENPTIEISKLPKLEQVAFQQLDPAYKMSEYIGAFVLYFVFLLGASFAYFKMPPELGEWRYGPFLVWGFLFAISLLLVSKRYELAGYALREHDVIYKYGVWWQAVTAIPFNRMQHCEISQGPIQNALGLATLRVFTAGGASSDLSIDGLHHEEAKRIKEFITSKISGQGALEEVASENEPLLGNHGQVGNDEPPTTNNQQSTNDAPI